MKKIFLIILSLVLVFALIGCGKSIKTEDGSISFKDGKIQINTDEGQTTIGEDGVNFQGDEDEGETSISFNEEGASLPEGYPSNIVPIIENGKVVMSGKDVNDGITSYWTSVLVDKSYKEAVDFYKGVMKDSDDKQEISSENMLVMEGTIKDHHVNINCIKEESEDGDTTMISIVIEKEE